MMGTSTSVGGCFGSSPGHVVSRVAGQGSVVVAELLFGLFRGPGLRSFGMDLRAEAIF
jgi:hypothetical protein